LRFLIHLGLMIGIALTLGFGLSWYALSDGRLIGTIEVGPWTAWRNVGLPSPDPYTRAYIARTGALELGASEGLRFVALRDSDGRALDRACTYTIDGRIPAARFWTLVPEAADGSPIARSGGPLDFRSSRMVRAADGSARLSVGKALSPYNWLEITGDGPFQLVLTLYDAQNIGGAGSDVGGMPAIVRGECG
jgi:hypothetical protein